MSAFSDYFEHLNVVTSTNYELDDITVDLSNSGVTPEYYAKIDERSDALLDFFQREVARSEVRDTLQGMMTINGFKDDDDLMLCLLMDFVHCFENLNHPTNLNTSEGIALLNVLEKVYRPDYYMPFEELSVVPRFIIDLDGMVSYIEGCIGETPLLKTQSIISALLQVVRPESDKEYRILLYRLCESVSEADGYISNEERDFLMSLLRLDDDDVTNDIETDSIFCRKQ